MIRADRVRRRRRRDLDVRVHGCREHRGDGEHAIRLGIVGGIDAHGTGHVGAWPGGRPGERLAAAAAAATPTAGAASAAATTRGTAAAATTTPTRNGSLAGAPAGSTPD